MAALGTTQAAGSNPRDAVQRLAADLRGYREATTPGQQVTYRDAQGNAQPMLPARLMPIDEDADTKFALLRDAGAMGFRNPELDAETREYLLDKMKIATYIDEEQWIAERFDLNNPLVAKYLNELRPDFLQRRFQFGMDKINMQQKLLEISVYGIRTAEDLRFAYAIDSGQIDINELSRPAWQIPVAAVASQQYRRGIFNPLRGVADAANRGPAVGGAGLVGLGHMGAQMDFGNAAGVAAGAGPSRRTAAGRTPIFGGAANVGARQVMGAGGAVGAPRGAPAAPVPFFGAPFTHFQRF